MQLLLAFLCLLIGAQFSPSPSHHLITFANDGTFYRFDPSTKQVDWINSLNFDLLSLDIADQAFAKQNETRTFIIPTIDGDFLYIDESLRQKGMKELVVAREDIQDLLDICFENKGYQNYFVYQKLEYYVLSISNGKFLPLEDFLKNKQILNKNQQTIMAISKKLLKQMNSEMKVKWSIISSTISLFDADEFVKNPKSIQPSKKSEEYEFFRKGSRKIQIQDLLNSQSFQMQSESPILSIFLVDSDQKISKVKIIPSERKLPAIQAKPWEKPNQTTGQIEIIQKSPNLSFDFPHSSEYQNKLNYDDPQLSDIAFCINSYHIIKAMNGKPSPEYITKASFQFNEKNIPTVPFSLDTQSVIYIPKQQPLAHLLIIFILGGLCLLSYFAIKTDKMKKLISDMSEQNDEKLNEIKKKLGEYENAGKQLKKMYEIYWDKITLNNGKYFIFEGRFLNQKADVYALPINGNDIIFIEHQLNLLIKCSHRKVTKLYYYTKNEDYLLIFTEAGIDVNSLPDISVPQKMEFQKKDEKYGQLIKNIIDSMVYLIENKVEFNCFVADSIYLSEFDLFKINIIPSLLQKVDEKLAVRLSELGTNYIRFNLVEIIHYIGYGGEDFDIEEFEKNKNTDKEQNFFLKDFYDFILTGHKQKEEKDKNQNDNLVEVALHPFLWDSKQRMLFISEFSNYLETNLDETRIHKLQAYSQKNSIITIPWNKELHHLLIKEINHFRKYDYHSVRDLIRLIRNKVSHFHELPKETRLALGKTPEQFVEYFLQKFPKLLPFMYAYSQRKKWKLHIH